MKENGTRNSNIYLMVLGGLILLFNFWLLPSGTDWKVPLDLKFGYDKEEAFQVLDNMGPETLPIYRFGLIVTDMIYPVFYAGFLSILMLRTWDSKRLVLLPVLILLLDVGENLSILKLVDTFPAISDTDTQRASFFSVGKWTVVGITFLLLIMGAIRSRFFSKKL